MAERTYFIKVSWHDPSEPHARKHTNDTATLDLTQPSYKVVEAAQDQALGRWADVRNFTIDFMIPVGNS